MQKKFYSGILVVLTLMLAVVLAACGDNPTATIAPTTVKATTASTTTTAPTTVTATTAPATTVKATTAATTIAATTPAATTTVASGNKAGIPAISGLKEVVLDQAILNEFDKQIPGLSAANATIKFYVSDDEVDQASDYAHTAIIKSGYKFGLPGQEKPTNEEGTLVGLYVKSGAADILVTTVEIPANGQGLDLPNLSQSSLDKLTEQIKGKKSVVVIIAAPQLLQALTGDATADPTVEAVATPAATKTTAASGNKVTIPADGTFPGELAVLEKVLKATGDFQSLKMVLESKNLPGGPNGTVIVVKPDGISLDITSDGKKQAIIALGQDIYSSSDGQTWTKLPPGSLDPQQLIGSFNQGSVEQIKGMAGSTFAIKPDEKLNGQDVGVLEIDTTTANGSGQITQLGSAKLLYKYDKKSYRLQQVVIKTEQFELDTSYLDYNSPNNKVEAPQ